MLNSLLLNSLRSAPTIDSILAKYSIGDVYFPGGTDKQSLHSYGPVYEHLLENIKSRPARILEIGVALGGSMLVWHEFSSHFEVIGLDISDNRSPNVVEKLDPARSTFLLGDAYDAPTVSRVRKDWPDGFDLMIDDGPHTLDTQIYFIENYVPMLTLGGKAVIEDIQEYSWYKPLKAHIPRSRYEVTKVDRRGVKKRYDDLMLIIEKI